jgi:hypothetical protein
MMPRAPPAVAPPLVLRPDWETLAILASTWSKSLDLDMCPTLSHSPVLWRNQQTETYLILKLKPRNHRGDFDTKSPNCSCQFWGPNWETLHHRLTKKPSPSFLGQTRENYRHQFWSQIGRNRHSDFEVKLLTNHKPWFLCSTKKPALLVFTCTLQTAYGVTQPLDRPDTEYLIYVTIPGPLQQVSYSYHNPRRCMTCHTCHLHTMRQANSP